jgi:hypothetical protein
MTDRTPDAREALAERARQQAQELDAYSGIDFQGDFSAAAATLLDCAAALAAPAQQAGAALELVGEWVNNPRLNVPHLKWRPGYVARVGAKLYAQPSKED